MSVALPRKRSLAAGEGTGNDDDQPATKRLATSNDMPAVGIDPVNWIFLMTSFNLFKKMTSLQFLQQNIILLM
jgi:hypothetical protein